MSERTPDDDVERPPLSLEEARRRVEDLTRDEVTLAEMQRLGFWPKNTGQPNLPAELIQRLGAVQREMAALATERARLKDREKMRAAYRKERLRLSREKQKETKERRERERVARAAAWAERKKKEILYLGEEVSAGLAGPGADEARLRAQGLPILTHAEDLAKAMEIGVGELRFLTFNRKASKITHYRRFTVPKKTGGQREIAAPMPRLKKAQTFLLRQILEKLPVHTAAHGFRAGRSILGNAGPHVGKAVVINFDLKDFFPSLTFVRVKGLFRSLGYGEPVAILLALIATEPEIDTVELDGQTWHLHRGPRRLPQGSPASPAITNLICRRLDRRLDGLATKLGFVYTRYADDLTFSAEKKEAPAIHQLLRRVKNIVEHEDFVLHPRKTRVMHRGRRQEVTGLTVNSRLAVDRKERRRFRALLFQIDKDGPAGKTWKGRKGEDGAKFWACLVGWAQFYRMVQKDDAAPMVAKVAELMQRHGGKLPGRKIYATKNPVAPPVPVTPPSEAPPAEKPWWQKLKFWGKE